MESTVAHNRDVQVHWFTINMPAVVAVATLVIAVYKLNAESEARQQVQEQAIVVIQNKMEAVDRERTLLLGTWTKQMDSIVAGVKAVTDQSNRTEYRLTVAEQQVVALGQRQDRFADAVGDLRQAISGVNTSLEVLTERIERSLDIPKSGPVAR